MDVSSALTAVNTIRPQGQTRPSVAQPTGVEGRDKENDGDKDDTKVTATRGQKVNIQA